MVARRTSISCRSKVYGSHTENAVRRDTEDNALGTDVDTCFMTEKRERKQISLPHTPQANVQAKNLVNYTY